MICNDEVCNCAIVSTSLDITGSGTTGDPLVIEQSEFSDLAGIASDIANINAELDTLPATYVNVLGDTMTGPLTINTTGAPLTLKHPTDNPYVEFRKTDGTSVSYIQGQTGYLVIQGQTGVGIVLRTGGANQRIEIEPDGQIYVNKGASDIAVTGQEIRTNGTYWSTADAAGAINVNCNRTGAANADGQVYASFRQAGTQIGRIERASGSSATYTASSDEELKENIEPIPDDLALLWMRVITPRFFQFKDDPTETRNCGYIAQEAEALWPNGCLSGVVSKGHGDPADRTWDAEGNETTPDDVWSPYGVAYERVGAHLHAGVQALDRIVTGLSDRVDTQLPTNDDLATLRDEVFYTRVMSAHWQFSNSATTPPGAGQIRTNTATTEMYLHKSDTDGYNREITLDFIVAHTAVKPQSMRFRIRGTSGSVLELRANGAATDHDTWYTIPVTVVSGSTADKGFRVEVTMLSGIWAEDPPPIPTTLPFIPDAPEPQPT